MRDSGRIAVVVPVDSNRIGVIIGSKQNIKKILEQKLGVKIKVNVERGEIIIVSYRNNINNVLRAKMVITAVSYGFSPSNALVLIENPEYILEVVNIDEYARSKKDISRIKSRLIGRGGKIRMKFEDDLNVKISIYDKYVSIIGKYDDVMIAKEAIISICRGSKVGRIMKKIEEYRMAKYFKTMME